LVESYFRLVFGFCSDEDGNVGVGSLPCGEEILICSPGFIAEKRFADRRIRLPQGGGLSFIASARDFYSLTGKVASFPESPGEASVSDSSESIWFSTPGLPIALARNHRKIIEAECATRVA
jgi:hypothetical protein